MNAPHDDDCAVVAGDVVVVADNRVADAQAGNQHQHYQPDDDPHPSPRPSASRGRLGRRRNSFGGALALAGPNCGGTAGRGVGQGQLVGVAVAGNRPGQNGLGLAELIVNDIGDDDGDVVGAATAQRQFDEAISAFGDVGDLQGLGDGFVADRVGQSVRAQQVAITDTRLPHRQGGLHLVTSQRAHDQRALRVAVRLLRGDAALVDQRLDKGVVLGDLRQLAVAEEVAARVADVPQPEAVAREQDRGQRGAHALEVGFHLDLSGYRGVAGPHGGVQLGQ